MPVPTASDRERGLRPGVAWRGAGPSPAGQHHRVRGTQTRSRLRASEGSPAAEAPGGRGPAAEPPAAPRSLPRLLAGLRSSPA